MFFISMYLCSCNQETVYSCNESIDKWVHENLSEIQVMSRSEWNNLEEEFKIPAYRAFTLQQRIDFWNEKLTDILSLEWSKEETDHINSLIDFINEHHHFLNGYSFMSDDEKNVFDLFFYQWMDKAKTDFRWPNKLLYAILASGNTLLDTNGTLSTNQTNNKKTPFSVDPKSQCNCSQSSDWCISSFASYSCEDHECEEGDGCGTLFVYNCNGLCGGI